MRICLGLICGVAILAAQDVRPVERSEVEQLREEVRQLKTGLEQLRTLLLTKETAKALPVEPVLPTEPTLAAVAADIDVGRNELRGTAQSTGVPQDRSLAMATKANGGDLSGAGNLLRTDRVIVGGYGDFQFRESGLNEKADGGGTPTFQNTRFVLGIAAVLSRSQNIIFNSEIEYEFGSREIDVEQAFVEWKVRPQFGFRAGIIAPSLGRFNTFHDSNLNLATLRPLMNQFLLGTAYRDAGIGIRGRFNLPRSMKLSYEANLVNGMQGRNADGEATPFSRLLGQASAAEPRLFAFQAANRHKAVTGRVGISPILGLEVGTSVYNGQIQALGEDTRSLTMMFYDGSYRRGPWALNAEYGRSNIVGGIPRRSILPKPYDPLFPSTGSALAAFVAATTPGQDGYYVEAAYHLLPRFLRNVFDESGYLAPVIRFEGLRRDRTLSDFYLNQNRTTLGLNIAPSSSVIFKMNYILNNPQATVPAIEGQVGGAAFGTNPIPFLGYGRNGFTGSVAYVF